MMLSGPMLAEIQQLVGEACRSIAPRFRVFPEAVQGEVFLRIVERLERLPTLAKPLQHYVRRSALWEARRACRHERKPAWTQYEQPLPQDEACLARENSPLAALVEKEEAQMQDAQVNALRMAVEQLPGNWREALGAYLSAEGHNCSVLESARKRGYSRTSVYNHKRRAISALRRIAGPVQGERKETAATMLELARKRS